MDEAKEVNYLLNVQHEFLQMKKELQLILLVFLSFDSSRAQTIQVEEVTLMETVDNESILKFPG